MTDFFPNSSTAPNIVKCDCQKKKIGGVEVQKPQNDQPTVILMHGIDSRFLVGSCARCGKVHTVRT